MLRRIAVGIIQQKSGLSVTCRRLWRWRTAVAAPSRMSSQCPVHPDLMKVLVCPLSKEPLRYDPSTNELVSDKLGVAYPILENGVPSLVPDDGRLLSVASISDGPKLEDV